MAIPNNFIDKITKDGDSRIISPSADNVRVDNENFDGADLDEVLDEVAQAIEDAGSGDGTVTGVKIGSTTYEPTDGVVDLSSPMGNKVDKVTGKGLSTNDYTNEDKAKVAGAVTQQQMSTAIQQAVDGIVAGETVVVNSDGANIVDEHDNNSVLLAPSARQMKLMYNNLMAMYNALANIAFTNGKPTLDWVGTKTKYTLSYGTLTGCSADVAAGQVDEGGLRIKLTPSAANYSFSDVLVNGVSVAPVSTGDADGSVYVDIIVNGNVTLSATAISGYGVSLVGTGVTLSPLSVAIGQPYSGRLVPSAHHDLPQTIAATVDGTAITFDGTTNTYNPATGDIAIANVTGDIVITASGVAQVPITVTLQGTNVVFRHGNDTLVTSVQLYADDKPYVINVKPTSADYVMVAPTASGCTVQSDGSDGYNITIPSSVVSDMTITAVASAPSSVAVTKTVARGDGTITDQTDGNVTAGRPYTCLITPKNGWGLKSANVRVKIDGNYISSSDYTLDIVETAATFSAGGKTVDDIKYAGTLTVPTSSSLSSIEIEVKFSVLLYQNLFITTSKSFNKNANVFSEWIPVCPKAFLPLGGSVSADSEVVWTHNYNTSWPKMTASSTPNLLFTNKQTYFSGGNNQRVLNSTNLSTFGSSEQYALGTTSLVAVLNYSKISDSEAPCKITFQESRTQNSPVLTVFDGADADSWIFIPDKSYNNSAS